jgi:ribosomal protein S18 acetylase RimI-like enzyme
MEAVRVTVRIEMLTAATAAAARPALVALLRDVVDGGASVGFLPPLGTAEAGAYWRGVEETVAAGTRIVLAARDGEGSIVGSAQLALETRPNGRHRAEVMKVMVLGGARRQGIGRALMDALEARARREERTTLVLDTRAGDPSERLYAAAGWTKAGTIPKYARSADGALDASAFYYRLLDPAEGGST